MRRAPTVRKPSKKAVRASRFAYDVDATATIHTLGLDACRWPIGEPDQAGFGFCGRTRVGHSSYCVGHALMAVRRRMIPLALANAPQRSRLGEAAVDALAETMRGGELVLARPPPACLTEARR